MVELPLEIIHTIITISLPRSDPFDRARQDFLLPICHLHSSLRRFTQRLLFSHVTLDCPISLSLFLDTVEGRTEIFNFGECVQSLQMGGCARGDLDTDEDAEELTRIIGRCGEMKEVTIHHLDRFNFAIFARLSSTWDRQSSEVCALTW